MNSSNDFHGPKYGKVCDNREQTYSDMVGLKDVVCAKGVLLYFVKKLHTIFEKKTANKHRRNHCNYTECARSFHTEF